MRTPLAALIACACCATAHAAGSVAELAREQALLEYAAGHFATASAHFRVAAEQGDMRSAETLSLMYRYGERLYGEAFRANPVEAAHWANVAATRRLIAKRVCTAE